MCFCSVAGYTRAFEKTARLTLLIRPANKFYQRCPDFMTSELGRPVHSPFCQRAYKKTSVYTCCSILLLVVVVVVVVVLLLVLLECLS